MDNEQIADVLVRIGSPGAVQVGPHLTVTFQRTLRIPDDGRGYPLPPGLGAFPVYGVEDYAERVPSHWLEEGGVFIPMYQREALWLNFECPSWRAVAVKVGVGDVNAVSGKRWHERVNKTPRYQDYVACPDQPWLDGINAGDGWIRQFVAMPLGMGYSVDEQLTDSATGGMRLLAIEPKSGRFPDYAPRGDDLVITHVMEMAAPAAVAEMGVGAGGRMRQEIYPDPHGPGTWDAANSTAVRVRIINSLAFRDITGLEPPPTPVSAELYTRYGLPWFDLYREDGGDLIASKRLRDVKALKEKDEENGFSSQQDDTPVEIPSGQVVGLE